MAFRELEMALSQAVMALLSCRLPPPCASSPYLIKTSLLSESHRWFGDNTEIKLDSKCFLWHPAFKTGCPCALQWGDFFTKTQYKPHFKILCFHEKLFISVNFKPKCHVYYWMLSVYGWNFWGLFDSICLRKCLHFGPSLKAVSPWLQLALYQTLVCFTAGKQKTQSISMTFLKTLNAEVIWRYSQGLPKCTCMDAMCR